MHNIYEQAILLFEAGKAQEALELFLEYHKSNPNDVGTLLGIASIFHECNQLEEAYPFIKRAFELAPNHLQIIKLYVLVILYFHQHNEAKEILESQYKNYKNNLTFLEIYFSYLTAIEDKAGILDLSTKILSKKQTPALYNQIAIGFLEVGEIGACVRYLKKGLELLLKSPPHHTHAIQTPSPLHALQRTLFSVKETLDALGISFYLDGGTLLGIYRDNDLLPYDKDLDFMLPWSVNRAWLAQTLEQQGWKCQQTKEHISGLKGQWNLSFKNQFGVVDFFFLKTHEDSYLTGITKGDKVLNFAFSPFEKGWIEYGNQKFSIPKNTSLYLEEMYGKEWNQKLSNYNTIIIGSNVIDPHYIRIAMGLNYVLGGILKSEYKKAHGNALQLLSVYDEPLLEYVCKYLEKNYPNTQWYPPIVYQQERIKPQIFE